MAFSTKEAISKMDIRKVKKLIELLEASDIAEIEIKEGEESVRISRGSSSVQPQAVTYQMPQAAAPAPAAAQAAVASTPECRPCRVCECCKIANGRHVLQFSLSHVSPFR